MKSVNEFIGKVRKCTEPHDLIAISDMLSELACIIQEWNKTMGFPDEIKLYNSINDVATLNRSAKLINSMMKEIKLADELLTQENE